jgi:hypothetical protein
VLAEARRPTAIRAGNLLTSHFGKDHYLTTPLLSEGFVLGAVSESCLAFAHFFSPARETGPA